MLKRVQHLLALIALAGLVATVACQQRQEVDDDEMGADTLMMEDTTMMAPPPAPPDTGMTSMEGGVQVSVTNPMPHAMTVTADWGQGQMELGTVQSNETSSFDISAPEGSQVTLTASDPEGTHNPTGTITLSASTPATWTIQ
jgi:hypothetical protein